MSNTNIDETEESENMLDFRSWISSQVGEQYSEQAIEGFGWEYVSDTLIYPEGVKTHRTTYTMTDSGRKYRLEVDWNSFNEYIVGSHVWVDGKSDDRRYRITFRSEIYVYAASPEEAEEKFGELELYSEEAEGHGAEYVETNSVEEDE
jgi:hypothetical protein